MRDKNRTKEQLIKELTELRQRIGELERSENERKKKTGGKSEEELRAIIDSVKDGMVILDLTGKVTTINKRITEIAGYAEEDIVGKRLKLLKMFPPKSIATMLTAFKKVVSGKQTPPYAVEVYTQTGKKLFVEIHGSLLKKGGKKAGIVAVLRDITERKQLEALLLRERETFVTILQNALYGVVLLDRDGKHVYVNPTFTAITGYTLEDIPTGRDWLHKAYPDEAYRQKVTELWKDDRRGGAKTRVISVVCKNGETKEIEFRSTVLDDGRSVVMLTDVTERERAEEVLQRHREHLEELVTERTVALQATNEKLQREIAERKRVEDELQRAYGELKESEERYRTLADNINLAINLMDSDHTLLMANAAQSKTSKKPVSDLIGEKCFREFEKRDAVCPHCPGVQTMDTGKPAEAEVEGVRDDGNRFHVRLQTFPVFGQDGTVTGFIEVVEDITERKQMEDELRESEERFKMLAEEAPFGISIMAPDRSFEYLNPRFMEIFGYTTEDIPDKDTWFKKAYPDKAYRNKVISIWKRDVAEEIKIGDENPRVFTVRCKDGQDKIIDFRSVDLKDGKQHLVYEDITVRAKAEELLQREKETFFNILQNALYGVALMEKDGKHVYVNPEFTTITGYTLEDIPTGEDWMHKAYPDKAYRQKVREYWENDSKLVGTRRVVSVVCKDGETKEIEASRTPLENGLSVVMLTDITERKQMEESLRERQQELQTLMDASPTAISWADLQGNIQYINRKHHELFGYTLEEIPTIDAWQRQADQDPSQQKRFAYWEKELMEAHKQGGSLPPREMTVTCKDGSIRYVTVEGAIVSNHNLVIYNDITERVRAEEAIRKLAYHDALTGLPNRVLFADRLNFAMSQAYRSQRRLAVMLLDLDRFKNVNDTFGHSVGDALLHRVGQRLTGLLRKNDTISRTGGDEFSLLMPEIEQEKDTVTVAQKVLDVFQEPFVLDVHELHITTSVGIAIYPDDGEDADTLLKHSDIAMYQAKQKGRNNYQRYTPI